MNRKNRGSRDATSAGAWRSVLRRAAAPCHQAEESQFPVMREERCSGVVATVSLQLPVPVAGDEEDNPEHTHARENAWKTKSFFGAAKTNRAFLLY
ncbi:hypothetical protein GQ55_3G480000 [Panicum hallii var. hallii]|uniref:Uncharacterized protein n=1 Tax=Panicum hallii var. hallii TaxID=1504633 RepID=A0A2T7EJI0_9POAL|nr:hypothetical protein GQ55_3G480000 [Panicum hallii var. hallii]